MRNLQEVETGTFQIDLRELPSLRILPRAISNRATEIEVFIIGGEVIIYAKDLSGNVTYIAQEKGADIEMFNVVRPPKVKIEEEPEKPIDNMEMWDSEEDRDEFFEMLSQLEPIENTLNGETKENSDKNSDNREQEKGNDNSNGPIEYCRFATSSDMLQILAELKEIDLIVKEDEIIISAESEGIISKFDRIKAYSEVSEMDELLSLPTWENFPLERVKSIIPVIEQIEEANYRQFLTLKDGLMFTFSDIIAIEAESGHMGRNYNLNSEVLRILKYSTAKDTDIKISELNNGSVCLNVDGLNIFFGPTGDYGDNLFEIPRQVTSRKPFIGAITKEFSDRVKMIKRIYKDRNEIIIEAKEGSIVLRNDKLIAIVPPAGEVHEGVKVIVDIDKLLLALRIADDNNAKFSLYEISEHRATIIVEGKVDVLIDTEEYYKEGDFNYESV